MSTYQPAYQPTSDAITLPANAVIYFALKRVLHFFSLAVFVAVFAYTTFRGRIHITASAGPGTHWELVTPIATFVVGIFLLLLAVQLAYSYFLVSSYRIQMRPDGISLHYGLFNTNNEVILFSKIQDIVISCNVLERMMGLATLTVQNAMSKPEVIPGLGAEEAEELREQILARVGRANTP